MRPSFAGGILAAVLMGGVSAQALAADLTIWWNKSYYPEEDKQFDKIVTDFEKEKNIDIEYSFYTNEDVPRKVLAALTAGEPPDLSYGFLFDLQHTARWAYEDILVGRERRRRRDQAAPAAERRPGGQPAQRQDRPALGLRHAGGAADRAHPRLEGPRRPGRARLCIRSRRPGTRTGTGGARPPSRRSARRRAIAPSSASASR
jgi:hypothetical protein